MQSDDYEYFTRSIGEHAIVIVWTILLTMLSVGTIVGLALAVM